mmetsp:Transcript_70/g.224  ORF Transcript_70/g.224 Transcript_70/m.224 type:complete len:639 (+) Transcript_70:161-2077(+)
MIRWASRATASNRLESRRINSCPPPRPLPPPRHNLTAIEARLGQPGPTLPWAAGAGALHFLAAFTWARAPGARACHPALARRSVDGDAVLPPPLLDDSQEVLHLRVARRLEEGGHVPEQVLALLARYHLLEDTHARAALPVPVLGVGVEALEGVEGLGGVEEGPGLVAVVGEELQHGEGLLGRLELEVELPRGPGLARHHVAAREPHVVDIVPAEVLPAGQGLQLEQARLRLRVLPRRGLCDRQVEHKGRVVGEVGLDGLQIDEDVVKLAEDKEAGCHALAPGDGVALRGGGPHELEVLLRHLEVLPRVEGLPHGEVDDSLEDVLLRGGGLHVLHQVVRLLHLAVVHVVDDQVEARLGDQVREGREHLEGALPAPEDHHVVPHQVELELVHRRRAGRERCELRLRGLAVVEAELVARLEVERHRRVRVLPQVGPQDLQGHVVVVQLVVTQSHVHVKGRKVSVLQEEALVDVRGLLEVVAEVVDGGEGELILRGVLQPLVVRHELALVICAVRRVKEQPVLERCDRAARGARLGLLVRPEAQEAAGRVQVQRRVRVPAALHEVVVRGQGLVEVAAVERGECQPLELGRLLLGLVGARGLGLLAPGDKLVLPRHGVRLPARREARLPRLLELKLHKRDGP